MIRFGDLWDLCWITRPASLEYEQQARVLTQPRKPLSTPWVSRVDTLGTEEKEDFSKPDRLPKGHGPVRGTGEGASK